jgi:hypothetical protein
MVNVETPGNLHCIGIAIALLDFKSEKFVSATTKVSNVLSSFREAV